MRRVHKREPNIVIAQLSAVGPLVSSRQQFNIHAVTKRHAAFAVDGSNAVQLPSVTKSSVTKRLLQREDTKLEHIATRVRLGTGIEQQPTAVPTLKLGHARGIDGGNRILENGTPRLSRVGTVAEYSDHVAPEVIAKQAGGEECVM